MSILTWKRSGTVFFTIFFCILTIFTYAGAQEIKTVCIIPFDTNSRTDISYISSGIFNMLNSRLSWKNKVQILKKEKTTKALGKTNRFKGNTSIMKLGMNLGADYVISGVITEFSGSYSIDTKVFDLDSNSFLTFYGHSESIEKVISNIDIIAAKINKKVFQRTTTAYEKFEKEKIIREEDLRRMNPEKMMPAKPVDEETEPWWKLW